MARILSICTRELEQWCTTFYGRGPLIDFLISSGMWCS